MMKQLVTMVSLCCILMATFAFAQSSNQVEMKYWMAHENFNGIDVDYPTWTLSVNHQFDPLWGAMLQYSQGTGDWSTTSVPPVSTSSDEDRRDIDIQVHRALSQGKVRVGLGYRDLSFKSDKAFDFDGSGFPGDAPGESANLDAGYNGLYLSLSGTVPLGKSQKVNGYATATYLPNINSKDVAAGDPNGDGQTFEFGIRAPLGGEGSSYYARAGYRYQKFSLDGGTSDKFTGLIMGIGTSFD